ncbi:diadenylate cyclase CdaA [Desulforhopalus singaporensis]|uniref:Diadenylate cyclase n=1 Tax=Desulforhopalus singaporensis TaxID=91360 RepID=A0A1H0P3N7_9BACT|nr:diadenylate cyclase CdaA [Desulforhopalus singaporensis]SDO99632.1 diadenylate cyclase [Desulforhopalus singaporensis]
MLENFSYFRWQDLVDILVVAFVIYQLISIIKGTRSVQMVVGIGILTVVYFMATVLDLSSLKWIFQTFLSSILIIVIIVFQQDIRRALTRVGKSPFHQGHDILEKDLEEIIRTLFYLAKRRIGALVVLERDTGLGDFIESGFKLDANLTKELLISVFMPVSPLHDGAVIVSEGKISHAGCILPLTQNPYINKKYGTRHRAAIGLSEETDAVVLVVSEETQEISIVRHGALTTVEDEISLTNNLRAIFIGQNNRASNWRNWISK